ncbi:acid protease, partial [Clavulina sp. PMI_390]
MVRALTATGLVALTLLPFVASAPSPFVTHVSLPITKRGSSSVSAKAIVDRDLARLAHYNSRSLTKRDVAGTITNGTVTNLDVTYVAPVTICNTTYNLIVDTGSSNTWAGVFNRTDTSCAATSGQSFSISYGSGSANGTQWSGAVSFAGLTVANQSFGVASSTVGFMNISTNPTVDGIIGFGPEDLTLLTVSGALTVPTFMENLKSQGTIDTNSLGVYFRPLTGSNTDEANGQLSIGGPDASKYTGTLRYFPATAVAPYSMYWGLSFISVQYGSGLSGELPVYSAIVDTGTTLIYIPQSAYKQFLKATGGATDSSSGLAKFTTRPTENFTITISGVAFPLTPDQYLVPEAQYAYYGLDVGSYYAWINNGGTL